MASPLFLHSLLVAVNLFLTPAVESVDPNEACPVFPQVTANPNTVHTQESPPGSRPWVVLLWVSCGRVTTTCEGSLIREDWVMTSVKCLPCGSDASVVADVGLHYNKIRKEMMAGRPVERVGAYSVHLRSSDHDRDDVDIALIHLTKKLNSSHVINLAECSQKKPLQIGRNCLSSGWGESLQHSLYDTRAMEDAYMGIWSSATCSRVTGISNGVVCAGAKLYSNITSALADPVRGVDSHSGSASQPCYVQLGASLVISQPKIVEATDGQVDIKCEWQLCGVLVQGMRCGVSSVPGVYTDICEYEKWITDTIRLAEEHLQNLEGCPTLPSPPINGYLCGLEEVASGKVHFCCERGYELSGPSISICDRNNQQWVPITGRCLPVSCPELPTPIHISSSPLGCRGSSYTMGCWFSCDSGYRLKGVELISCQEDGTWSNEVPNCEAIDCGPPPVSGNLLVGYTETTYKSMASYQCKSCYELTNGNSMLNRTCDSKGRWTGPFPICRVVHCEQLTAPLYGQIVQTSDTCGSQVRFECMEGFTMIGINRATCLPTGKWSSSKPFCVSASCPQPVVESSINFPPPTPDNPPYRNYSYGDHVLIRCEKCHEPVGGRVNLTCLQGGIWDGSPPICQWVTCPLPSLLPNGQIFPLGHMYFCGTHVRFRCYPGYNLIGSPSTHCKESGEWSNPFPACRSLHPDRECSLFEVENGKVSITHTAPGGIANVSCDQCYSLEGSSTLKCTEEKEWDKPLPTCRLRHCPDLGVIPNGIVIKQSSDSTITCNDVMLFGCDDGFVLDGPLATTCLYNGRWSHPVPTCRAIRCQPPPPAAYSYICAITTPDTNTTIMLSPSSQSSDDDGSGSDLFLDMKEHFPPGSILEYCCRDGTVNEENIGSLTCTETGKWSHSPPKCRINGCQMSDISSQLALVNASHAPERINDNTLVYPSGTVLKWTCKNTELMLYGSPLSMCSHKNNDKLHSWNHHMPLCINVTCFQTCPIPIPPENGRIVSISNNKYTSYGGISEGTVVIYLCNRNHQLHGSISRKCLVNGVWSGQETLCLTFKGPDSKVIIQNPETKQWQSVNSWHFMTSQQVYLACQTISGLVTAFRKVKGPRIDTLKVRVSEFGDEIKSRQLLLKPTNPEGAKSIAGAYMCQVKEGNNLINRTVDIYIHENFCPFSNILEGSITVSGQTPGSCHHVVCDRGYKLLDETMAFRMCQNDGSWSSPASSCVLEQT